MAELVIGTGWIGGASGVCVLRAAWGWHVAERCFVDVSAGKAVEGTSFSYLHPL